MIETTEIQFTRPTEKEIYKSLVNWLNQTALKVNEDNLLKCRAAVLWLTKNKPEFKPSDYDAALNAYVSGHLGKIQGHYGQISTEWIVKVMMAYYRWRRMGGEQTPQSHQISNTQEGIEQSPEERNKMNWDRIDILREQVQRTGRLPVGGWKYLYDWLEEIGEEPYTEDKFHEYVANARHRIEFESKMERGALATEYFMQGLETRNSDPVIARAKVMALTDALMNSLV